MPESSANQPSRLIRHLQSVDSMTEDDLLVQEIQRDMLIERARLDRRGAESAVLSESPTLTFSEWARENRAMAVGAVLVAAAFSVIVSNKVRGA
jgi:hypothetical protein